MTIDELAIKNNTDKSSLDHNYAPLYQMYFDKFIKNPKKILELGVYSTSTIPTIETAGASLRTWSDYFPNTKIYGLDISDYSMISKTKEYPNIETFACNGEIINEKDFDNITHPWLRELYVRPEMVGGKVGLDKAVENFGSDYDIIIDDGPHTMSSQQIFLKYMFRHLKSKGLFVVEDLHTSRSMQIDRTGKYQFNSWPYTDKNTLWMFENFIRTKNKTGHGKIDSDFMTTEEMEYLENNIAELYIEKGRYSEIVFIIKK